MAIGAWKQTPSGEDRKLEQTPGNDPLRDRKDHHRSDDRKLCYWESITGMSKLLDGSKAKQDFTHRFTKGLWTIFLPSMDTIYSGHIVNLIGLIVLLLG